MHGDLQLIKVTVCLTDMHKIFIIPTILFIAALFSCEADEKNCENLNPGCYETPPAEEACAAAFQRWFFDKNINSCKNFYHSIE